MDWYYILLIAVGCLAVLLFAVAFAGYLFAFGARCDKNALLQYYRAEDFALSAQPVTVGKGLHGAIYRDESTVQRKTLVVFCHGLGAGHAAYMTEVARFCSEGFTVLAVDNAGCDLSQGKSIRGMYSGVKTALASVSYARSCGKFEGCKIVLVGHSWGGYSALCASAYCKVDGVVAMSAPVTPVKTLYYGASQLMPKLLAAILCPFWAVIDFFNFGMRGNLNAAKCAEKSNVPVLLVQGDNDTVVPMGRSAYAAARGDKITKYLAVNKNHNPYNTVEAQRMMVELSAKLSAARKLSEEEKKYFETFDFKAATEEDAEVMNAVITFVNAA